MVMTVAAWICACARMSSVCAVVSNVEIAAEDEALACNSVRQDFITKFADGGIIGWRWAMEVGKKDTKRSEEGDGEALIGKVRGKHYSISEDRFD
ncbi:hypothetical protein IW140_001838 [Coemansia sp. RSA 1813]|nr:hypothetical protein EV178_002530 [Coemansia sp. RSA 1646]KAJ1772421.1 hypothetical protein LPJ74_001512 [Coemansia sp. RSA 1843]KAJ2091143.1 hypothetical protein IW138_002106 [Coemansia sp. RSA 986]KAJ2213604.1 hypothetical protein EV179_003719 [Coemansia sp. RSA 487]KAJ2571136.1 hypothetical protein IW140_001838 [Coemansia sp. RSA 1813]